MPIPSQKDIRIPLLHLIHSMGGEAKPRDVYVALANYFNLTEKERRELLPSSRHRRFDNRVAWARKSLCVQGLIDSSIHGVWKITEKGRRELSHRGLIDKPFPIPIPKKDHDPLSKRDKKEGNSDDEEIINLVLAEVMPYGAKKFPDDFLDDGYTEFYEIELPGMQLYLAPKTETIITSQKGYFRYQAKNPVEAKYILYGHEKGLKRIRIPKNNLIMFKVVKTYEKYCRELIRKIFDLFIYFTHDEEKAELLTNEAARRLGIKVNPSISMNSNE